jgi:hypothetical protein
MLHYSVQGELIRKRGNRIETFADVSDDDKYIKFIEQLNQLYDQDYGLNEERKKIIIDFDNQVNDTNGLNNISFYYYLFLKYIQQRFGIQPNELTKEKYDKIVTKLFDINISNFNNRKFNVWKYEPVDRSYSINPLLNEDVKKSSIITFQNGGENLRTYISDFQTIFFGTEGRWDREVSMSIYEKAKAYEEKIEKNKTIRDKKNAELDKKVSDLKNMVNTIIESFLRDRIKECVEKDDFKSCLENVMMQKILPNIKVIGKPNYQDEMMKNINEIFKKTETKYFEKVDPIENIQKFNKVNKQIVEIKASDEMQNKMLTESKNNLDMLINQINKNMVEATNNMKTQYERIMSESQMDINNIKSQHQQYDKVMAESQIDINNLRNQHQQYNKFISESEEQMSRIASQANSELNKLKSLSEKQEKDINENKDEIRRLKEVNDEQMKELNDLKNKGSCVIC